MRHNTILGHLDVHNNSFTNKTTKQHNPHSNTNNITRTSSGHHLVNLLTEMAKRKIPLDKLLGVNPAPPILPANAPKKFMGYIVKPKVPRKYVLATLMPFYVLYLFIFGRLAYDKKSGEVLRLAKPRNTNITPGREFNKLYERNMREWIEFVRDREKMEYRQVNRFRTTSMYLCDKLGLPKKERGMGCEKA